MILRNMSFSQKKKQKKNRFTENLKKHINFLMRWVFLLRYYLDKILRSDETLNYIVSIQTEEKITQMLSNLNYCTVVCVYTKAV
jgi:hypothetical protein